MASEGLRQIYPPGNALGDTTVDIIAIHGLGTTSRTWIYEAKDADGKVSRHVNWLSDVDMMPAVVPSVRVFTFSWNARYYEDAPVVRITDVAEVLLRMIQNQRDREEGLARPLMFIGSCFGGLIVTKALDIASMTGSPFEQLRLATTGVVFIGTPLQGTKAGNAAQWQTMLGGILNKSPSNTLLQDLDGGTKALRETTRRFNKLVRTPPMRTMIICFWETQKSQALKAILPLAALKHVEKLRPFERAILVEQDSACLDGFDDCPLDASHFVMNKYAGPSDPNFGLVIGEIRKMVEKATGILKQQTTGSKETHVHYMVSRRCNPRFTGRAEELNTLQQALSPTSSTCNFSSTPKVFVIHGMGGAGKSEVALQFASENRESFWAIFWIDASSESSAIRGFEQIAKKCDLPEQTLEATSSWLQETSNTWLLVLDNADDSNLDYSRFLPQGNHGSVLITTRVKDCAIHETVGSECYEKLNRETAIDLLLKTCNIDQSQWDIYRAEAEVVADLLGLHALAITQAGAFIREGNCVLSEYGQIFQTHQDKLLVYRPTQGQSIYGDAYATLEVSAAKFEQQDDKVAKDALKLLQILAFMHHEDVSDEIFEEACRHSRAIIADTEKNNHEFCEDEDRDIAALTSWHVKRLPSFLGPGVETQLLPLSLRQARTLLTSLSIVSYEPSSRMTRMHPVAHMWARSRCKPSHDAATTWLDVGNILALSIKNPFQESLLENVLHPHLDYFSLQSSTFRSDYKESFETQQIIWRLVWALLLIRSDSAAEKLAQLIPTKQDPALLDRVSAQQNQYLRALCLKAISESKTAVQLLRPLIAAQKQMPKQNDGFVLDTQWLLASALTNLKKLHEAVHILETSLATYGESVEESNCQRRIQIELAGAYLQMGEARKATELLEKVVAAERKIGRQNTDRNHLRSQKLLAKAYQEIGAVDKGAQLLSHVMEIQTNTLRKDHPDLLDSQAHFASMQLELGETMSAIAMLEHVVRIESTSHDTLHQNLLGDKHKLAGAYLRNSEFDKATKLQESVVEEFAVMLPVEDRNRLYAQHLLAECYCKSSLYDKALTVAQSIVHITPSPPDPSFAEEAEWLIYRILQAKHEAARGSVLAEDEGESVYEMARDTLEGDENDGNVDEPTNLPSQTATAQ